MERMGGKGIEQKGELRKRGVSGGSDLQICNTWRHAWMDVSDSVQFVTVVGVYDILYSVHQ